MSEVEIKPGVTFWFTGCGDNESDDIDVTSTGIEPFLSYDEALESATSECADYGGSMFVIECRVSSKVSRGKIRVKKYPDGR